MSENVVEIWVQSKNDTRAGFDEAKADAEIAGDEAGQGFMSRFAARLTSGGSSGGGIAGALYSAFPPASAAAFGGGEVLAAALAATVVELVGVVNGFAAATVGVGALALVAIPTFERVRKALADTPAQLAKQPALIRGIVAQVDGLKKSFDAIGASMMPQLLGIFNQGLGIAAQLMPVVATFAKAAAPAVSEVMTQLSKSISSAGFQSFVDKFSKISGPAIEAMGQGFGKVAVAVGRLLTVMSAHDVVHSLNIAFDALADSINLFAHWVSGAMNNWDRFTGAMQEGWKNIVDWSHSANNDIHGVFDAIGRLFTSDPETWVHEALAWFASLPGKAVAALNSLSGDMFSIGVNAIEALGRGAASVFGGLLHTAESWGHDLANAIGSPFGIHFSEPSPATKMIAAGMNISKGLAQGITAGRPAIGSALGSLGGVGGGGAGGGGVQVVFSGAGAAQMRQFVNMMWPDLMLQVRSRGGGGTNSVQRALGQVS